MGGMGTIEHVVGGCALRRGVNISDCLAEGLAGRQAAIRLQGVSKVKEITTGIPAALAARTTPIASLALVMVILVTMSAPASAKAPI
jgi:hypothetical protein